MKFFEISFRKKRNIASFYIRFSKTKYEGNFQIDKKYTYNFKNMNMNNYVTEFLRDILNKLFYKIT